MNPSITPPPSAGMQDTRADSEPEGISFWQLFLHRKWLIMFCVSVGLGLGYLYFNRQPPVYESSARLHVYVDQKRLPIEEVRYIDRRLDLQNTHIQIIRSPMIVAEAVEKHGLKELPSLKMFENPVGVILGNLSVSAIEDTDIINLSYRCRYPDDCKRILIAIAETYKQSLVTEQETDNSQFENLITDATVHLQKQIDASNDKLSSHRRENLLTLQGDVPYNPHQLRMVEIDEQKERLKIEISKTAGQIGAIRELQAQGEQRSVMLKMLERFDRSRDSESMNIPSTEGFLQSPDLIQNYVQLEIEKLKLGDDHPRVKQIKKEIEILEKLYGNLNPDNEGGLKSGDVVEQYLRALEHQIRAMTSMIAKLDEEYNAQRTESYQLASLIEEDRKLQGVVKANEQLVGVLSKRLSEVQLVGPDSGGMRAQVIAPPERGGQVAINFNQIMTLAGGMGLMVGLLLGYILEVSDTSFRGPDDIATQLGVPVLGHIPAMDLAGVIPDLDSGIDTSVCTYYDPKSRAAEAYRAIRTALYFSTRGEGHKLVQVTSPDPGDGKSTLAANLAVSIAHSGKRVLLIDADFRRPRVHRVMGLSDDIGITSVITGTHELPEAIQHTAIDGLDALVCGPRPSNPSELLTSPRFEELLDVLRERYDFVIVDTPPMLAVTDPSAVAARVDGVFVAMRLKPQSRVKATQAVRMLTSLDCNILGVVVNGVGSRQDHAYGTSYSYGNKNRYGTYGEDEDDGYWFYYDEDEVEHEDEHEDEEEYEQGLSTSDT